MKYTQGPWVMEDRVDAQGCPCGIDIVRQVDASVASLLVCRLPDGATKDGGKAWPYQLANARLIAYSPDLLEAAERMVDALNATGSRRIGLTIQHDELVVAIQKAKGGS